MESKRKGHGIKLFDVGPFSRQKKDKKDKDSSKGKDKEADSILSPGLSTNTTSPSSNTSTTPSPEKKSSAFSKFLSRSKDRKDDSKQNKKERSPSAQPRSFSHDRHRKKEEEDCDGGEETPPPAADQNGHLGSSDVIKGSSPARSHKYSTLPSRMTLFGGKLSRPKSGFLNVDDDEDKKSNRSLSSIRRAGSGLSIFDFRKSNQSISHSLKSSSDRGESDGDRDSRREVKKKEQQRHDEDKGEVEREQEEDGEKKHKSGKNMKSLGKKLKKGFSSLFSHKRDKKERDSGVDDIRESDEDSASAMASSSGERRDTSDLDSESIGNFSMSSNRTSLYEDTRSIVTESTLSRYEQKSMVSASTISEGGSRIFHDSRNVQDSRSLHESRNVQDSRKLQDNRNLGSKIPIIDAVRDPKCVTSSLEVARKMFGVSDLQLTGEQSENMGPSDVHSKNKAVASENTRVTERTVIPNMGMNIYEKKSIARQLGNGVYDHKGPERVIPPNMGTNICAKRTQEIANSSPTSFGSNKETKKIASFLDNAEVRCLYSKENAVKPSETRDNHAKPIYGSNSDLSYKRSPLIGLRDSLRRTVSVKETRNAVNEKNDRNERFSSPLTRPAFDKTKIRGVTRSKEDVDQSDKVSCDSFELRQLNEALRTLDIAEKIVTPSKQSSNQIGKKSEEATTVALDSSSGEQSRVSSVGVIDRTETKIPSLNQVNASSVSATNKSPVTQEQIQSKKIETSIPSAPTNIVSASTVIERETKRTGSTSAGKDGAVAGAIFRALEDKGVKDITEDTIKNVLASFGITGQTGATQRHIKGSSLGYSSANYTSSELESSESDDMEFYDSVDASEFSDPKSNKVENKLSDINKMDLVSRIIQNSNVQVVEKRPTLENGFDGTSTKPLSKTDSKESLMKNGTESVAQNEVNGVRVSASSLNASNQMKIKDILEPSSRDKESTTSKSTTSSKQYETETFPESDDEDEFVEASPNVNGFDSSADNRTSADYKVKVLAEIATKLEEQRASETKKTNTVSSSGAKDAPQPVIKRRKQIPPRSSLIIEGCEQPPITEDSFASLELKKEILGWATKTSQSETTTNKIENKSQIPKPIVQTKEVTTTESSSNKTSISATEKDRPVSSVSNNVQNAEDGTVLRRTSAGRQRDSMDNSNRCCAIIEVASSSDDNEDGPNADSPGSDTVLRIGSYKGEESDDTGYLESSDSTTTSVSCLDDEDSKLLLKGDNRLSASQFADMLSERKSKEVGPTQSVDSSLERVDSSADPVSPRRKKEKKKSAKLATLTENQQSSKDKTKEMSPSSVNEKDVKHSTKESSPFSVKRHDLKQSVSSIKESDSKDQTPRVENVKIISEAETNDLISGRTSLHELYAAQMFDDVELFSVDEITISRNISKCRIEKEPNFLISTDIWGPKSGLYSRNKIHTAELFDGTTFMPPKEIKVSFEVCTVNCMKEEFPKYYNSKDIWNQKSGLILKSNLYSVAMICDDDELIIAEDYTGPKEDRITDSKHVEFSRYYIPKEIWKQKSRLTLKNDNICTVNMICDDIELLSAEDYTGPKKDSINKLTDVEFSKYYVSKDIWNQKSGLLLKNQIYSVEMISDDINLLSVEDYTGPKKDCISKGTEVGFSEYYISKDIWNQKSDLTMKNLLYSVETVDDDTEFLSAEDYTSSKEPCVSDCKEVEFSKYYVTEEIWGQKSGLLSRNELHSTEILDDTEFAIPDESILPEEICSCESSDVKFSEYYVSEEIWDEKHGLLSQNNLHSKEMEDDAEFISTEEIVVTEDACDSNEVQFSEYYVSGDIWEGEIGLISEKILSFLTDVEDDDLLDTAKDVDASEDLYKKCDFIEVQQSENHVSEGKCQLAEQGLSSTSESSEAIDLYSTEKYEIPREDCDFVDVEPSKYSIPVDIWKSILLPRSPLFVSEMSNEEESTESIETPEMKSTCSEVAHLQTAIADIADELEVLFREETPEEREEREREEKIMQEKQIRENEERIERALRERKEKEKKEREERIERQRLEREEMQKMSQEDKRVRRREERERQEREEIERREREARDKLQREEILRNRRDAKQAYETTESFTSNEITVPEDVCNWLEVAIPEYFTSEDIWDEKFGLISQKMLVFSEDVVGDKTFDSFKDFDVDYFEDVCSFIVVQLPEYFVPKGSCHLGKLGEMLALESSETVDPETTEKVDRIPLDKCKFLTVAFSKYYITASIWKSIPLKKLPTLVSEVLDHYEPESTETVKIPQMICDFTEVESKAVTADIADELETLFREETPEERAQREKEEQEFLEKQIREHEERLERELKEKTERERKEREERNERQRKERAEVERIFMEEKRQRRREERERQEREEKERKEREEKDRQMRIVMETNKRKVETDYDDTEFLDIEEFTVPEEVCDWDEEEIPEYFMTMGIWDPDFGLLSEKDLTFNDSVDGEEIIYTINELNIDIDPLTCDIIDVNHPEYFVPTGIKEIIEQGDLLTKEETETIEPEPTETIEDPQEKCQITDVEPSEYFVPAGMSQTTERGFQLTKETSETVEAESTESIEVTEEECRFSDVEPSKYSVPAGMTQLTDRGFVRTDETSKSVGSESAEPIEVTEEKCPVTEVEPSKYSVPAGMTQMGERGFLRTNETSETVDFISAGTIDVADEKCKVTDVEFSKYYVPAKESQLTERGCLRIDQTSETVESQSTASIDVSEEKCKVTDVEFSKYYVPEGKCRLTEQDPVLEAKETELVKDEEKSQKAQDEVIKKLEKEKDTNETSIVADQKDKDLQRKEPKEHDAAEQPMPKIETIASPKEDMPKTETKLSSTEKARESPDRKLETLKSVKDDEKHVEDASVLENKDVVGMTGGEKLTKDSKIKEEASPVIKDTKVVEEGSILHRPQKDIKPSESESSVDVPKVIVSEGTSVDAKPVESSDESLVKIRTPDENFAVHRRYSDYIEEERETIVFEADESECKDPRGVKDKKTGLFSSFKRMLGISEKEDKSSAKQNKKDKGKKDKKELETPEEAQKADLKQVSSTHEDEQTSAINKVPSLSDVQNVDSSVDSVVVSKDVQEEVKPSVHLEKMTAVDDSDKKCEKLSLDTSISEESSVDDSITSSETGMSAESKSSTVDPTPGLISEALKKDQSEKEKSPSKPDLETEAAEKQKIQNEADEKQKIQNEADEKLKIQNEADEKQKIQKEAAEKLKVQNEAAEKQKIQNEADEKQKVQNEAVEKADTKIKSIVERENESNLDIETEKSSVVDKEEKKSEDMCKVEQSKTENEQKEEKREPSPTIDTADDLKDLDSRLSKLPAEVGVKLDLKTPPPVRAKTSDDSSQAQSGDDRERSPSIDRAEHLIGLQSRFDVLPPEIGEKMSFKKRSKSEDPFDDTASEDFDNKDYECERAPSPGVDDADHLRGLNSRFDLFPPEMGAKLNFKKETPLDSSCDGDNEISVSVSLGESSEEVDVRSKYNLTSTEDGVKVDYKKKAPETLPKPTKDAVGVHSGQEEASVDSETSTLTTSEDISSVSESGQKEKDKGADDNISLVSQGDESIIGESTSAQPEPELSEKNAEEGAELPKDEAEKVAEPEDKRARSRSRNKSYEDDERLKESKLDTFKRKFGVQTVPPKPGASPAGRRRSAPSKFDTDQIQAKMEEDRVKMEVMRRRMSLVSAPSQPKPKPKSKKELDFLVTLRNTTEEKKRLEREELERKEKELREDRERREREERARKAKEEKERREREEEEERKRKELAEQLLREQEARLQKELRERRERERLEMEERKEKERREKEEMARREKEQRRNKRREERERIEREEREREEKEERERQEMIRKAKEKQDKKEREEREKQEKEEREERERQEKEERERIEREEKEKREREEREKREKEEREKKEKEEEERRIIQKIKDKERIERELREEREAKEKEKREREERVAKRMEEMDRQLREEKERRKKIETELEEKTKKLEKEELEKKEREEREAKEKEEREKKEREEAAIREQEERERWEREEIVRKEREERERVERKKKEAEERERKEREEKEREEKERLAKIEKEKRMKEAEEKLKRQLEEKRAKAEKEKKEKEEKERKEREEKLRIEREEKERKEKERKEKEEKLRLQREEKEKKEREEKERIEKEKKEKEEKARKEREEKERKEREEKERIEKEKKEKEEKARIEREEKERKEREEKERVEREEKEKKEKEEKIRLEREEKERQVREEKERKVREEKERVEREEKEKKEKEEKIRLEREEKERQVREEKDRKEKEEKDRKEKEEKERKQKEEKEKSEKAKKAEEENRKVQKTEEKESKKERKEKKEKSPDQPLATKNKIEETARAKENIEESKKSNEEDKTSKVSKDVEKSKTLKDIQGTSDQTKVLGEDKETKLASVKDKTENESKSDSKGGKAKLNKEGKEIEGTTPENKGQVKGASDKVSKKKSSKAKYAEDQFNDDVEENSLVKDQPSSAMSVSVKSDPSNRKTTETELQTPGDKADSRKKQTGELLGDSADKTLAQSSMSKSLELKNQDSGLGSLMTRSLDEDAFNYQKQQGPKSATGSVMSWSLEDDYLGYQKQLSATGAIEDWLCNTSFRARSPSSVESRLKSGSIGSRHSINTEDMFEDESTNSFPSNVIEGQFDDISSGSGTSSRDTTPETDHADEASVGSREGATGVGQFDDASDTDSQKEGSKCGETKIKDDAKKKEKNREQSSLDTNLSETTPKSREIKGENENYSAVKDPLGNVVDSSDKSLAIKSGESDLRKISLKTAEDSLSQGVEVVSNDNKMTDSRRESIIEVCKDIYYNPRRESTFSDTLEVCKEKFYDPRRESIISDTIDDEFFDVITDSPARKMSLTDITESPVLETVGNNTSTPTEECNIMGVETSKNIVSENLGDQKSGPVSKMFSAEISKDQNFDSAEEFKVSQDACSSSEVEVPGYFESSGKSQMAERGLLLTEESTLTVDPLSTEKYELPQEKPNFVDVETSKYLIPADIWKSILSRKHAMFVAESLDQRQAESAEIFESPQKTCTITEIESKAVMADVIQLDVRYRDETPEERAEREREEKEKLEREVRENEERIAKELKERKEKEKKEMEERAKQEREEFEARKREERRAKRREERERQEREEKEKKEREEREKKEEEQRVIREAKEKERREKQKKLEEKERQKMEEIERQERREIEKKEREEKRRLEVLELERNARKERERKEREQKEKEERERKEKEEKEEKERMEREAEEREVIERQERIEKRRMERLQREKEEKERKEKEEKERVEAEAKKKKEEEEMKKAKVESEKKEGVEKVRVEGEGKEKVETESEEKERLAKAKKESEERLIKKEEERKEKEKRAKFMKEKEEKAIKAQEALEKEEREEKERANKRLGKEEKESEMERIEKDRKERAERKARLKEREKKEREEKERKELGEKSESVEKSVTKDGERDVEERESVLSKMSEERRVRDTGGLMREIETKEKTTEVKEREVEASKESGSKVESKADDSADDDLNDDSEEARERRRKKRALEFLRNFNSDEEAKSLSEANENSSVHSASAGSVGNQNQAPSEGDDHNTHSSKPDPTREGTGYSRYLMRRCSSLYVIEEAPEGSESEEEESGSSPTEGNNEDWYRRQYGLQKSIEEEKQKAEEKKLQMKQEEEEDAEVERVLAAAAAALERSKRWSLELQELQEQIGEHSDSRKNSTTAPSENTKEKEQSESPEKSTSVPTENTKEEQKEPEKTLKSITTQNIEEGETETLKKSTSIPTRDIEEGPTETVKTSTSASAKKTEEEKKEPQKTLKSITTQNIEEGQTETLKKSTSTRNIEEGPKETLEKSKPISPKEEIKEEKKEPQKTLKSVTTQNIEEGKTETLKKSIPTRDIEEGPTATLKKSTSVSPKEDIKEEQKEPKKTLKSITTQNIEEGKTETLKKSTSIPTRDIEEGPKETLKKSSPITPKEDIKEEKKEPQKTLKSITSQNIEEGKTETLKKSIPTRDIEEGPTKTLKKSTPIAPKEDIKEEKKEPQKTLKSITSQNIEEGQVETLKKSTSTRNIEEGPKETLKKSSPISPKEDTKEEPKETLKKSSSVSPKEDIKEEKKEPQKTLKSIATQNIEEGQTETLKKSTTVPTKKIEEGPTETLKKSTSISPKEDIKEEKKEPQKTLKSITTQNIEEGQTEILKKSTSTPTRKIEEGPTETLKKSASISPKEDIKEKQRESPKKSASISSQDIVEGPKETLKKSSSIPPKEDIKEKKSEPQKKSTLDIEESPVEPKKTKSIPTRKIEEGPKETLKRSTSTPKQSLAEEQTESRRSRLARKESTIDDVVFVDAEGEALPLDNDADDAAFEDAVDDLDTESKSPVSMPIVKREEKRKGKVEEKKKDIIQIVRPKAKIVEIVDGKEVEEEEEKKEEKKGGKSGNSCQALQLVKKGGFAKCYEVIEQGKPKEVLACKIVPKAILVKSHQRDKMFQEINIHRSLHHKNIVTFFSFFEDDHFIYILLELCRRRSLMEMHKRRRAITEPETQYFVKQVVEACQYLHNRKVIHRDLKLGNLFLGEDLDVKIGDFGLATTLDFEGERKRTLCGTPNYIAPEVLSKKGHSFEVDVWSLGCIVYTLLVGKPPFETSSLKETYSKIKKNEYDIPSYVSWKARSLIQKLLKANPNERPSMDQIIKHEFFSGPIPTRLPASCLSIRPRIDTLCKQEVDIRKPLANVKLQDGGVRSCSEEKENVALKNEQMRSSENAETDQSNLHVLNKLLDSVINGKNCDRECFEEDLEDPAAIPLYWVSKWVDYSDKYGIGYMLCDNSFGVLFNDSTGLILMANVENMEYIERDGSEKYFTMTNFPESLTKKVTLLKYFRNYMSEHLLKAGANITPRDSDDYCRLPFLKTWFRTRSAINLHLSNGTVQINFFEDHTKLILCPVMGAVTYIDEKRNCRTYRVQTLQKYGSTKDLYYRLRYAKNMVDRLITSKMPLRPKVPTTNQNAANANAATK